MDGNEASGERGRRGMNAYSAPTAHIANVIKVSQQPCEKLPLLHPVVEELEA